MFAPVASIHQKAGGLAVLVRSIAGDPIPLLPKQDGSRRGFAFKAVGAEARKFFEGGETVLNQLSRQRWFHLAPEDER